MVHGQNSASIIAASIIGVCLLVGLSAAGYFVGRGTARFKSDVRSVTVKDLVEPEVKADDAVWTLNLRRAGDNLKDAHTRISADRDTVLAFLQKRGRAEQFLAR